MKPSTDSVIKVGGGRGFVIVSRVKNPPWPHLKHSTIKLNTHHEYRLVVTAAHCLPKFPEQGAATLDNFECTYKDLLGTLDGKRKNVWAECLYVDPVSDVAILGTPDTQELGDYADAYAELTDAAPALRIGNAKSGHGWMLSLKRRWIQSRLEVITTIGGTSLEVG
jgi:hypothetical protein